MRGLRNFSVRRVALVGAATMLAALWATGPIGTSADTLPVGQCATNTNPTTGQTIQACEQVVGVNVGNTETATLSCYAISGTANVQTSISCSATGKTDNFLIQASSINAPGDVAATADEGTDVLQAYTVCVTGVATDVNNNAVSASGCF